MIFLAFQKVPEGYRKHHRKVTDVNILQHAMLTAMLLVTNGGSYMCLQDRIRLQRGLRTNLVGM